MPEAYTIGDDIPIGAIRPGTVILIAGPRHDGSRELCLSLAAGISEEGTIFVTTNASADRVVEDCETIGADFHPDRAGIVDCTSGEQRETFTARVLTVSGPRDLTGIGLRYSELYNDLYQQGVERIRSGLLSVSALLTLGEVKQVSRFVHTLAGRITAVNGVGFFLVDPSTQDERTVNTIAQFCDARIDVRDADGGAELRTRGLADEPRTWQRFETPL